VVKGLRANVADENVDKSLTVVNLVQDLQYLMHPNSKKDDSIHLVIQFYIFFSRIVGL